MKYHLGILSPMGRRITVGAKIFANCDGIGFRILGIGEAYLPANRIRTINVDELNWTTIDHSSPEIATPVVMRAAIPMTATIQGLLDRAVNRPR